MRFTYLSFISFIILSVVFTSCKKDTENQDAQLRINFSHNVEGETLEFEIIKYTNAAANTYGISTLKYFVSSFVFTKTDGTKVTIDEVYYIDATKTETITFEPTLLIPSGDYQSFSFIFGLDEEHNISGAFPNPPESNMEWPLPMGGGYHYMKLEGKFDTISSVKNYQAHTGRLMETPHFIDIAFPEFSFAVDGRDVAVNISMNINNWWVNPHVLNLNNISGIMGNETMQQQLQENGSDVFSLNIE